MIEKPSHKIHISLTARAVGEQAADYVARLSAEAMAERGRFVVAISGGSLPKLLSPPLVGEPLCSQIDWSGWHVFFADERCVPLTHPESNYQLAGEYLFDQINIPVAQIYSIDDSLAPKQAAEAYQNMLQNLFANSGQRPVFDLILLGIGEDGHTASLFPNHPLLSETERWVASIVDSPKPPPERITLTLPVINNARHVAFLAAGAGKADTLLQVLETDTARTLPAQLVKPINGELHWFVDEAAAAKLTRIE